jgi:hypothetical protein
LQHVGLRRGKSLYRGEGLRCQASSSDQLRGSSPSWSTCACIRAN